MTYLARPARHRRRPRPALGGLIDDLLQEFRGGSQEKQCIDQANQAAAPFDGKITDLATSWTPTGFYTAAEVRQLVRSVMAAVSAAQRLVDQAAAEPNASQDSVMRATDDLARVGQRSLDYLSAAATADQQGLRLVNAAGLKRWVTDSLASASSAMVTAATIGCITPWWVGALASFQRAFDVAWGVAKGIAGAALAIGETALEVVDDLPNLYNILKWGAVAAGAYWLWVQFGQNGHR